MKKRLFSFILIFFVLFNSLVFVHKDVNAAPAVPIAQLAGYVLSITGAADVISGGRVGKVARDTLEQKISELMGTGIYTDSDGNYVFSSEATKALYDSIGGNSNVRVVSSFGGLTPMAGLAMFGNPIFSNNIKNFINQNRTLYSSYLCFMSYFYNTYRPVGNCCNSVYVNLTNVAYMCFVGDNLYFYNNTGDNIYTNISVYTNMPNYSDLNTTYSDNKIQFRKWTNADVSSNRDDLKYYCYPGLFMSNNDFAVSGNYNEYMYINFPLNGINGGSFFWSNRSLLISTNSSAAFNQYKYPSGVVYANNYDTLPSISSTAITNNNWDSIYNNYVSNVSSNVSNFYDIETNQYNYEEMYKYIKTFNNNITNEVETGNTDIEQNIDYNNQWLSLIYDRLGDINIKLDNTSSGGGNDVWTQQDIADIKASLLRLEGSLTQEYSKLEAIYTYLAILNNSIQAINSSDDPINIYNDYSDYYDILVDLPVSDVDDIIDKGDTVKELVPTVAPFSYLNLAGNILDDLTAQPVEPSFTIPLTFNHAIGNQAINIDEDLVLDLSDFNDIRLLVNGFFIILFIFGLCWLSVFIIKIMLDLLSWG